MTSSKLRQFSVVLHNVQSSSKPQAVSFVQSFNPLSHVVALEPYPDQDGYHLHIFVKFGAPRSFKGVLSSFENFSKTILEPKPEGEERAWGRVQVDQMRGSFAQATSYLTNPTKDKPVDPDVNLVVKPNPYEEMRKQSANDHLRLFYGSYHFPDVGLYLQGFQYVELLKSQGKDVPPTWSKTYDFIKNLKI